MCCTKLWRNMNWRNISRYENTKADTYILQDEDGYYNWEHVKFDPFNTEVKTGNVKTEEKIKTKQDSRWEECVQD